MRPRRTAVIHRRNERGQSMVELSLALPVFCVLLFGIIQFGIIFNNYVTLTDATRAGARKAAVGRFGAAGAPEGTVRSSAANLDQSKLNVNVDYGGVPTAGKDVVVTASYPYSIHLFGIPFVDGTLTSKTTERVE